MQKQVNFQLDEDRHIAAKKRIADLKISFSTYVAALIQYELKHGTFDGVDVQELIEIKLGDGGKRGK